MTAVSSPAQMTLPADLPLGATFSASLTVTETHIVIGAGLIGGFQPVHVDHEEARRRGFAGPILHGSLTAAIMSAVIGRSLPAGKWAFLGQDNDYRAPVVAGDTLTSTWRVAAFEPHERLGGTVVRLDGDCTNQRGERVAQARARLLYR
jgi:3-hydroxybutyryl-CoA dehydratase